MDDEEQGRPEEIPRLERGIAGRWELIDRARRRGNGQLIRISRRPKEGWFGSGVCAGIAAYRGSTPRRVRLQFLAVFLFCGLSAVAYVVLRLYLPVEDAPADH